MIKSSLKTFFNIGVVLFSIFANSQSEIQKGEEDFYKGNHAPNADYILNGGLIKDLPPLPKIDFNYEGKGFDGSRLSAVPEAGAHPRVIMSPSDIERMKAQVRQGDNAPNFFRIQLEILRRNALDWQVPENFDYYANPFGADSNIAKWALYALLTDDEALGKKAAVAATEHALYLETRLDILNESEYSGFNNVAYDLCRTDIQLGPYTYKQAYYLGGAEKVQELKKKYGVTLFFSNTPGSYLTLGWEYDYAYNFMTPDQRDIVRRVISKATYGKFDTGMAIPGQMYINNHMSAGANWIALALAIEDEEGYDSRILPIAYWSLENKLNYDLSSDGMTFENTKGFIPMLPVLAVSKRYAGKLLKHSHLLARANSEVLNARKLYNRYVSRRRERPNMPKLTEVKTGYDEPRFWRSSAGSGTGGHVEFWNILKYFYPDDEKIDFVYSIKNSNLNADTFKGDSTENYNRNLHSSWSELPALTMLTASNANDYNDLEVLEKFKKLPEFWYDKERGMVTVRNGWNQDGMMVHLENRVDQYYAGHETPQQGDFQVWADGIAWSPNVGAYRDASYRAMVTVDGLAGIYQPVSGDWMTARNEKEAAISVSEMTTAYGWRKYEKLLELDHPTLQQANHIMGGFKEQAYQLNRFTELPFQPQIKEHYDGLGHKDYGPWHGETRGVERYGRWANNEMEHVFRTMHFARGENPYLLIFDDLKKDGNRHQFDWRMPVTGDAYVYEINPAVQNRHLEFNTEGVIGTDIILAMANTNVKRGQAPTWVNTYPIMKPTPKQGEPMLLVRVLWRNTNFPFPVPNVQRSWGYNMISIPANAVSPEYKVMVYPYRFGEKLPTTIWSDDMSQLTVKTGDKTDIYSFDKTDNDRTVYSMTRNDALIINSKATPPQPKIIEKGAWTKDQNRPDWRAPRLFSDVEEIKFETQPIGSVVHYTLDGTEPNVDSPLVKGDIYIKNSSMLKAKAYQKSWKFGKNWSKTATFDFKKVAPERTENIKNSLAGLSVKAYEIKTTIYDKAGYFQGSKKSIPDITLYEPIVTSSTANFSIPHAEGKASRNAMAKAFYVFQGFYEAPEDGVYRFELESCGPIDFKIGSSQVLLVDEQYGLSYKKRYGEVILTKGKHELSLLVCDIMFWKGDIEKPYEIKVNAKRPNQKFYTAITNEELSTTLPFTISVNDYYIDVADIQINSISNELQYAYTWDGTMPKLENADTNSTTSYTTPGIHTLKIVGFKNGAPVGIQEKQVAILSAKNAISIETIPGANLKKYDRISQLPPDGEIPANGLAPKYFNITDSEPYSNEFVQTMNSNDSPRKLMVYTTYIDITADGVYEFDLFDGQNYSAQLLIDDEVILKRRVDIKTPSGKLFLKEGKHKVELHLALGKALIYIKSPGKKDFVPITASSLTREATPDVYINDELQNKNNLEILKKRTISLDALETGFEIRYSFDSSKLHKKYSKPITIEKSATLHTALFKNNKIYGAIRTLHISKNTIPQKSLIAYLPCESIENGMTPMKNSINATTVVQAGEIVDGKHGKAIGFYNTASEAIIDKMSAVEDAVTVAMWVKIKEKSNLLFVTGLPYFYEEYAAGIKNDKLFAEFSRSVGYVENEFDESIVAPGKWFHIAITFGEENSIYVNGQLINSVQVTDKNIRRGSGLAPKIDLMVSRKGTTNAAMDECRIYDRVLAAEEIKTIYNAEK